LSLAIFDLDNTLIAGDSDHSWGEFLVEKSLVDGNEFKRANDQFYLDYKNGVLDIVKYSAFALQPLTQHPLQELFSLRKEFIANKIQPLMLEKAAALITSHREKGDTLLIITATNRFVTEPIASALNIENLLATEPEMINQRYTGNIVGVPCFQHGKVVRLQKWLQENAADLENSYFYSDSINDLPLLEQVTYPIAVDPDQRLTQEAKNRGWQIISLR